MCIELFGTKLDLLRLVFDWVPFLIFVGLMVFFLRFAKRSQKKQQDEWHSYREAHLEAVSAMNAKLDRIVVALEREKSTQPREARENAAGNA